LKIIRDIQQFPPELLGGAIAIGNFDGVHKGHARLIESLLAQSQRVNGPAIVFTFDPHPVRLLRPEEAPAPLTWTERKAELLGRLGVDALVAYRTDVELLQLEPKDFFQQLILDQLGAKAMTEGPNFFFGKNRAGDVRRLAELCSAAQVALQIVNPLESEGEYISSSRVRALIQQGEVAQAKAMLTSPYRLRGMVTHGARRGGGIGFPTANLEAIDTVLPAQGVYAAAAHTEGRTWPAAVNIGPNPTFGEDRLKVEVHLIGFQGTLYGSVLEVDFLDRLRGVQRFGSLEELQSQLKQDVAKAKEQFVKRNDVGQ